MRKVIPSPAGGQVSVFTSDPLTEAIRREVGAVIEQIVAEEMLTKLDAGPYARTKQRQGYRNGSEARTLVTSLGPVTIQKPRARVWNGEAEEEFRSDLLPRYRRRARALDDAILSMYLGGVNTRKLKKIVQALYPGGTLSASAVSRIVARLREHFEAWRTRSLAAEELLYVYLDAIMIKVRSAGRVVSRAILVAVGVRKTGEKVLYGLYSKGSESHEACKGVLDDLVKRGLRAPKLAIIDGGKGLRSALEEVWSRTDVQRCAVHKLRNLLAHAPKHAHEEVREDFRAIVYAETRDEAQRAHDRFMAKWSKRCESVATSLAEAGSELLTFFAYPKAQWKSLRTTNVIERLNGEFRRRVKTQASYPNEEAVLVLLFGLLATGQVRLHKISGWEEIPEVVDQKKKGEAA